MGGNPSAGENRREKQAGKVRAGPARAFVAAILRASLDGFCRGDCRRVVRGGRRSCGVGSGEDGGGGGCGEGGVVGLIQNNDITEKRLSQRVAAR